MREETWEETNLASSISLCAYAWQALNLCYTGWEITKGWGFRSRVSGSVGIYFLVHKPVVIN